MSFEVGKPVRLRKRPGEAGEVLAVYPSPDGGDEPWYKVRFANGTMTVSESALMEPGIPDDPADQLRAGLIGGMSELRLLLTVLRLKERNLTDQLRSLRAARLQHLPYQYKPLLKFLESDEQRVLIADEVGLGKTIEAGLILLELMARQEVSRVLVVVPSNLIIKWQTELRERFELEFEHRDNRWIREVILAPARDGAELPRFQTVVGLESVRLLAAEFDEIKPPLDLVIVDEAHRMRNDSSLGHKLGRALGESSEAMLLCSATPMQTAGTDLHNLLRVMLGERAGSFRDFESDLTSNRPIVLASSSLARNELAPVALAHLEAARSSIASQRPSDLPALDACIEGARRLRPEDRTGRVELLASLARLNWFGTIMTRTRKRMVLQNVAPRVAKAVPLDFTPEEMDFYRSVCEQTRSATSGSRWDGKTFSAIMRQRQAASCLAAFREQALESDAAGEDEGALRQEMSVDEDQGADEDDRELRIPELPTDSKLRAFLGLLDELRQESPHFKLIVFATFRATVFYLGRKLTEQGWEYEVLTGSVTDRAERMARVHRVRDDRDCNILLATEVGCEGIDLQFASNLVNYDLPWNPMTVEQRIGRLDRIGQTASQIRIFNLCVNGTVEERILTRLYERLHLFEQSIGALEVIVGERIQRLALDLARLSPEEQNARLDAESLVLEAMQHDAARLDAEAVNLVGDDAYYSQRLLQIEARQGDIAEDLRVFVVDFLRREFKRADLVEADRRTAPGVLQLTFDSRFHEFIAARRDMFGPASRFVGRYVESRDRGLPVTFDQKVAEARRDVEFITTTHGLLRAIADHVDANRRTVLRAFSVKVKSAEVPAGTYVLGIALHRVSGIRPRNEIVPAAVPLEDGPPLTSDQAETIAAEVLRSGENAKSSFTGAILEQAATRVELALVARCRAVEREVEQETRVSTGRRVESLKRWYGSRIRRAREQAEHHVDERVRRMARGRLAKLEVRLEQEIRAAEGAQRVESSSAIEGFVVVSVAA